MSSAAACIIWFFLTPMILPKQPRIGGGGLDIVGQLLLGLGIIAFLFGVSQLGRSLTAVTTLAPLIGGVVLLAAFFVFEGRSAHAFYPVRLFKSPIFLAAVLAGFVYNYGIAVSFLQTTNLWQYVTGVSTKDLAVWQLPLVAAGVVSALIVGRLMAKGMSNAASLLINTLVTAAGFVLLSMVSDAKSLVAFLPGLILVAGVVGFVLLKRSGAHAERAPEPAPVTG